MAEPFLGEIRMFGFNFAPRGWAFCNHTLLPISQNSALFSLLGTIYGGDGRTTFALPQLQGRMPMHFGNGAGLSSRRIGQLGGAETTTLGVFNMPSHNHSVTLRGENFASSSPSPAGNMLASGGAYSPDSPAAEVSMNSKAISQSNQGGGQSFNNMPPFQAVNFCIALVGIFPSRS